MDNTNIELVSKLGVIASTLSSIEDLKTLALSVNHIVDTIIDVEYNGLYLFDQDIGKLKLHYAKGLNKQEQLIAEQTAMERHPGWVYQNKEVLLISDTQKEKTGQSMDSERSFVIRSRVWLPIMSLDTAVGAFGLASTKVDSFSKEHISLLSFVCNLAGVVYNNITLKNKQQKSNRNLTKALDDTNRAKKIKKDFLAKMSHEIRTPMNAILGMTNLLADTKLSDHQAAYSKTLTIASKNLLKLLDDILDFSRLESENYTLENIPINPVEILKKAYHSLKFKAREKKLQISFEMGDKVPTFIMGDPLRLGQITMNLVSNAIKFTSKGSIHMSCKLVTIVNKRYRLQFRVTDSGVGIKKEKQTQIFKSFQQEDDSTTREFGGSGLGLSIAKEIVELYGGKIWVESIKKKGSSFIFEIDFDLPKELKSPQIRMPNEFNIKSLNQAHILLVEDNDINRFLAKTILEKYHAIVGLAENGQIAVEKVKTEPFDLILMDVQMPVMDGLTACTHIRKNLQSSIPIIALTANAIRGDSNKCFDVGMNDYITKPYEETDLITKIGLLIPDKVIHIQPKANQSKAVSASRSQKMVSKGLYDLSNLKTIANNNPSLLINLIQVFIKETPHHLNELLRSYETNNPVNIGLMLHKIKSSIGIISIPDVMQQIKMLETNIKSNTDRHNMRSHIVKLTKKIELVLCLLEKEVKVLKADSA